MAFTRLSFSKLWTNPSDFPTVETNETQVRADMQVLHTETATAVNALMTALEGSTGADSIGVQFPSGTTTTIGTVIKTWLGNKKTAIENLVTQFGSLTKTTSVSAAASAVDTKLPTEKAVATALSAKAASTHASTHATGGSDAITPANIGAAASSHNHAAGDITSGTLAVGRGGTGQTSTQAALTSLLSGNKMILTSTSYGTSLPSAGTAGRVFFKKVT